MIEKLTYLLFQIRNSDDPMRDHEIRCFSRALGCPADNIRVHDLLTGPPAADRLAEVDAVLIGGSGDYSVVTGGEWFPGALEAMRQLHRNSMPTFASCWGFQALAAALGGKVINDLNQAELGTPEVHLTEAGKQDRIFGQLDNPFRAQIGHEDIVIEIPSDAILLASTDRVCNQAFTFESKLIYATQFHPELDRDDLILRMQAYPKYVKQITGLSLDEFVKQCLPAPQTRGLLTRFAHELTKKVSGHRGPSASS